MEKRKIENREINLRSEEVQEILGSVPPWILRGGITLLSLFMVVLLAGSALFKYPDIITTSMILTGTKPVGKVIARSSGKISELNVRNNQEVHAGDYLAVLDNPAITADVIGMKNYLIQLAGNSGSDLPLPSAKWNLGEMQNDYIQFYLILKQRQHNSGGMQAELETSLMRMKAALTNWEQAYALAAPFDGKVAFTNVWSAGQVISAGSIVFNILPHDQGELIGKAMLPVGQSGKVKVGQNVNVHFDSFPDNEFGVVRGKVKEISLVPADGFYYVDISFPDGLKTTYKKELPVRMETSGKADIVTEDISLLGRFFMPLQKILNNQ